MNRILIISTFIVLTSCGQANKTDNSGQTEKQKTITTKIEPVKSDTKIEKVNCIDFDFNSAEQQADSILAFIEKAQDSSTTNRNTWEQKFFCAFPNSFKEMQTIFGFENEDGAAPLYRYPKGENAILYFSQLESIPDSIYYDKYIRINIDGIWEADNIGEAFNFAERLIKDTKNACIILSTFSDKEIKSVFRFIFDGPHPKNEYNEKQYMNLKSEIDRHNERLSRLLTESYEKLLAEDDGYEH